MKRNLFLLGLAVAAMTSCTNDEVLEQAQSTQKAIGFESFVNKGTRAIGETTTPVLNGNNEVTGLSTFYAYGYHGSTNDFNGVTVTGAYDGVSAIKWTHNGDPRYWADETYYFAAYANGNSADAIAGVEFTNKTLTISSYTVSYTTAAATKTTSAAPDLVAAMIEEDGDLQRTAKVNFTFKHLLTKIQFKVVNNNNQSLTVDITDVVVSGVKNTGKFVSTFSEDWTPNERDWTVDGAGVENFIPIAAQSLDVRDVNGTGDEVTSDVFYVLPQQLTADGIKVTFTAHYMQGTSEVSTQEVALYFNEDMNDNTYTTWKPGYSYLYTIGLPQTATPIEFGTPTVNPTWENGGTIYLQ